MLPHAQLVSSVPSARAQIGTVGQFRQLHYVAHFKSGLRRQPESESQIESVNHCITESAQVVPESRVPRRTPLFMHTGRGGVYLL